LTLSIPWTSGKLMSLRFFSYKWQVVESVKKSKLLQIKLSTKVHVSAQTSTVVLKSFVCGFTFNCVCGTSLKSSTVFSCLNSIFWYCLTFESSKNLKNYLNNEYKSDYILYLDYYFHCLYEFYSKDIYICHRFYIN